MRSEIWKDVVKYEGVYKVSNTGKIFSVKRNRLRRPQLSNHGYLVVCLSKNGVKKTVGIHTLVARAFLGERPIDYVIDHINGVPIDNSVENLQYVTTRENTLKGKVSLFNKSKTSKSQGVHWYKSRSKWKANITYNGKSIYLIKNDDENLCSRIYQEAKHAIDIGEFEDFMSNLMEAKERW